MILDGNNLTKDQFQEYMIQETMNHKFRQIRIKKMTQPKNTINGGHGLTTTENERENK